MKIAPKYEECVVHVHDASRAVGVVGSLRTAKSRATFDRDNRKDQAVLVDFPHRRFYFFWIEIWPQEVYYLTGLLILASVALFLFTVTIFGILLCTVAADVLKFEEFMDIPRFPRHC